MRPKLLRSFAGVLLTGAVLTAPGVALAASATISFSGHVPMRESQKELPDGATVVVGFTDRVLLPVPAFAAGVKTGEIHLEAMDKIQDAAIWRFSWRDDGGGPPALLEVPLEAVDETRYRVCVHSKQIGKKQCRAYRIVPAPGIKP